MAQPKSVFIVGPGFIGSCVVDLLVAQNYSVTALVRRKEHGDQLTKSGVSSIVMGGLHDHELIARHASTSWIVFHTATADDIPSVEAILDGVKQRAAQGKPVLYIHTSGTSVLDDNAHGAYLTEKIYTDETRDGVDSVADNAPHRPIDLTIVRAQKELGDKAKIAIMIPPLIYGFNPDHQRLTIQIPILTRFALKHGYAGMVGEGLSVESCIHVLDLARAYIVLLHKMESSPPSYTLENPYFFCESGEFSWKEVAENVGKELHKAGKISNPEAKTIPEDNYGDVFGDYTGAVVGLNSRSRAIRLRQLGWAPREKSIWASYREDELPQILAENNSDFAGYAGALPAEAHRRSVALDQ